jgi:glucose/arabinose dehydrogenase
MKQLRHLLGDLVRVAAIFGLAATTLAFSPNELPSLSKAAITWPTIALTQVASGLSKPLFVTHAGDGSGRRFVVEKGGQIKIIWGGSVLPTPFLNISTRVASTNNEEGLLSVAFPPDYKNKGHFYVYYTNLSGNNVLARYEVSDSNPDVADSNSETILLTFNHPGQTNHNGGQLAFGPDGYLYIGTGDGGGAGDTNNNAQNKNSLLGKILRIDVESGATPYASPSSNPFINVEGLDEIWAVGVRNPWRFSFDRSTGDLYIADVGQGSYEEIDFQPGDSSGGQNYGWRIMEANSCYNAGSCNTSGLTLPIHYYDHDLGCSVTGGNVYRGSLYNTMNSIYFYADYCTGRIWGLQYDGAAWQNSQLFDAPFLISSFGEDEAGEIYVSNYSNGIIYRLVDPNVTPNHTFADVPSNYWAYDFIESFSAAGITSGCGTNPLIYCPDRNVTRAEMAVFILRTLHYPNLPYTPAPQSGTFNDLPVATKEWMEAWVEEFYDLGITTGCAVDPLRYCPERNVTRAEMAVFLLRAKYGNTYTPPPATHEFGDMPVAGKEWMEAWVDQFYREGITTGCIPDPLSYCPEREVTRAEMAVFILRAFDMEP